ncbi:MAG: tRNA epoxyqueuosine(34) reductase QueG [Anaerolineales bacterium]|nr:tRNA epoxyqueuosine(34) reductase QueG [Anaerolineales bacterium]
MSSTVSSPKNLTLTQALKNEARRLGFQLVGVTTPDTPVHYPVYESWLNAGLHGEMAYLAEAGARARRADPRQILPECESILILGLRYPSAQGTTPPPENALPRGRIASYAWGTDYHTLIPPRLAALVQFIETQIGHPVPNRWYTDTGPILERDLAQRAGLGWIGKNTCLINPQQGSYFLLAEILLGLPLELDAPFPTDHCGSCTRCLDACPTTCLLPNRTLDASRCLAYLTIELKGPIPVELRPLMGNWVFGCDLCQQVCPWNIRFASPEGDPAFAPRPEMPAPDLCAELTLTPAQFNQKFKNSPLTRPKRRGYLRNLAVALGNAGDPAALPALAHALADSEPLVRAHAAWAIGQIGGPEALSILEQAFPTEPDPIPRAEIAQALAALKNL